jgi:hypothetical protein
MTDFVQDMINSLDKTTEAGFAEALLISLSALKDEQGLLLSVKLSDDFNQQIDFAKQIARMMLKERNPWVGLEAEEILDLFDRNNVYGSKWIEFARTVEAKLKERNT